MPIEIKDIAEYNYCLKRGLNPLLSAICDVDINLRIELQRKMFPTIEKYYRWNWDHKPHYCEECLRPLHNYSAVYVSHILSRGAHPEMAFDPRNNNILCFDMEKEIIKQIGTMATKLDGMACETANGNVYLFGGSTGSTTKIIYKLM